MKQYFLDACICAFLFFNIKGLMIESWAERWSLAVVCGIWRCGEYIAIISKLAS